MANDPDRFIGSFIVTVKNHENMIFETFQDVNINVPKSFGATLASDIGILTLSGEEILIPLDGQHRLAALRFAVTGRDEKQAEIPILHNSDIARDTCSVILIRDDIEKGRKIFNKVNRYASQQQRQIIL